MDELDDWFNLQEVQHAIDEIEDDEGKRNLLDEPSSSSSNFQPNENKKTWSHANADILDVPVFSNEEHSDRNTNLESDFNDSGVEINLKDAEMALLLDKESSERHFANDEVDALVQSYVRGDKSSDEEEREVSCLEWPGMECLEWRGNECKVEDVDEKPEAIANQEESDTSLEVELDSFFRSEDSDDVLERGINTEFERDKVGSDLKAKKTNALLDARDQDGEKGGEYDRVIAMENTGALQEEGSEIGNYVDELGLIFDLIAQKDWEGVSMFLETVPEVASVVCLTHGTSGFSLFGLEGVQGNLPLHEVCKYHPPIGIVNMLINIHEDAVKTPGQCAYLPIHYACSFGASADVITRLIEVYPNSTRERDELDSALPLHLAAKWGASDEVIMEILATYPEASSTRDASGKTPMDYVMNLPSEELRLTLMCTLEVAPILVAAEKYATKRITLECEGKIRDLKESHAKKLQKLEMSQENEKVSFLKTEISLTKMILRLQSNEAKLKEELEEVQKTLERERAEFRSNLEVQERDMMAIIDGAVEKVESLHDDLSDTQELRQILNHTTRKCEKTDKLLTKAKSELKYKDKMLHSLNQLLASKNEEIKELMATGRIASEKAKTLSNVNRSTQKELKSLRLEKDRFRKLIQAQNKELSKLQSRLEIQTSQMPKKRLGSIENVVETRAAERLHRAQQSKLDLVQQAGPYRSPSPSQSAENMAVVRHPNLMPINEDQSFHSSTQLRNRNTARRKCMLLPVKDLCY